MPEEQPLPIENRQGIYFPNAVADPFVDEARQVIPNLFPAHLAQSSGFQLVQSRLPSPQGPRFSPEDSKALVLAALNDFDRHLGRKAEEIFNNGFDEAAKNNTIEDKITASASQWRVRTVDHGKIRAMSSAPGNSADNPNPHAVIQYDFDGTVNGPIYLAHEVGHAIADAYTHEAGFTYSDSPSHMTETQAYFVQHILYDYVKQHSELEAAHPGITHAFQQHFTATMAQNLYHIPIAISAMEVQNGNGTTQRAAAVLDGWFGPHWHQYEPAQKFFESIQPLKWARNNKDMPAAVKDQIERLHIRPLGIFAASGIFNLAKGQSAEARHQTIETILGRQGPKNISDVLAVAGVTNSDDMEALARSTLRIATNIERKPQTHRVINLVVDTQFGTDPAFIERTRRSADALRARGIPTIWLTMDNRSQLYPPTENWPSASPRTRDTAQLEEGGFFGHAPGTSEESLHTYHEHFAQYGPRMDEAMYPKAFFDAFATSESIKQPGARQHYLDQERPEHIGGIDNVFHGQILLDYLKSMGVEQVTIMGGNADVCVTETAMGAARNGIRATILSDHIVRHTDQAGTNPPEQYENELRVLHDQTLNRPHELVDYPTKRALSTGAMYSEADKLAIRNNLHIETLENFLSHPSGPTINRQQEQQQQLRAPTPVQSAADIPVETSTRTAPVVAGATGAAHSINGKVGAASIAINLADAAIKGDGTKAAEVGGTAVALEGGMKVVAKVAGVRAVPVAGQIVGAGFAGVDAYEAATSGNTTRAIVSGTEATLYTVAAGAGAAAAFNFWNPVGWGAGTVAGAAGATAVTITAAKAVYDNWNTVTGWFGYHAPSSAPDQSPHPQVTEAATPPITNKTRGSGRGSLRLTTADQTSPPQEASAAMPLSPKRQAVTSITPAPA